MRRFILTPVQTHVAVVQMMVIPNPRSASHGAQKGGCGSVHILIPQSLPPTHSHAHNRKSYLI